MNVFTVWQDYPGQAEFMRAWDASWSARGWAPRILTARDARVIRPSQRSSTRVMIRGIGWVVSTRLINFHCKPGILLNSKISRFGKINWESAGLVLFDAPGQIASCGRALC